MPTLTRPNFKAKTTAPDQQGQAYVFFVGRFRGVEYHVSMALKVTVADWKPDHRGKGNGRLPDRKHPKLNDKMDAFESRLYEVWEKYPNRSAEQFRELVRMEAPADDCLPLGEWIKIYNLDEAQALRRIAEIGKEQETQLTAFIRRMSESSTLKSLALYNGLRPKSFFEFLREFVETTKVAWYEVLEKHLVAFAEKDGMFDFDGIDWFWHERFTNFLYTDQFFHINLHGKKEIYRKRVLEQATVTNLFSKLRRVMNAATDKELTTNKIAQKKGFVPAQHSGNGAPLYLPDMQILEGADFSGKPKLANIRLVTIRGFCTALRISDLARLGTMDGKNMKAIEVRAQKTKDMVGIPLMPLLAKVLHIPVNVPGKDARIKQMREMLEVAGIDRPLTFTSRQGGVFSEYPTSLKAEFSPHDLRRSAATSLIYDLAVERWRVKLITGHRSETVFENYLFPSAAHLSAESLTDEWREKQNQYLFKDAGDKLLQNT